MAGFADDVYAEIDASACPGRREVVLSALGDDADEFVKLEADASVPAIALFRVLKRRGILVSESSVRMWCRKARE